MTNKNSFSETLRFIMEHTGHTQQKMATLASVDLTTFTRWLSGKTKKPGGEYLNNLADELNIPVRYIIKSDTESIAKALDSGRISPTDNEFNRYIGDYYTFAFTTRNTPLIVKGVLSILSYKMGAYEVTYGSGDYTYAGTMKKLGYNLFLLLTEHRGMEVLQIVAHDPLPSRFDILQGVFSCISTKKEPVAGKMLFINRGSLDLEWKTEYFDVKDVDEKITDFLKLPQGTVTNPNNVILPNRLDVHLYKDL